MRAAMSALTFKPLPLLEKVACGGGLLAALIAPRGVEEAVIPAVVGATPGPEDMVARGKGRGGSSEGVASGAGFGGGEDEWSDTVASGVDSGDSTRVAGTWSASGPVVFMMPGRENCCAG